MKRFARRKPTEDQQLKLMARADELKAQLLRTSNETVSIDGGAMTNSEAALATPRPSLDQMWGLE